MNVSPAGASPEGFEGCERGIWSSCCVQVRQAAAKSTEQLGDVFTERFDESLRLEKQGLHHNAWGCIKGL